MKTTRSFIETFDRPELSENFTWFNPPLHWLAGGGKLSVQTAANTDFWQKTYYNFIHDNGHFLYAEIDGDFVLETRVQFWPRHQYDQAGLMVRLSPECWLKTSVEFEGEHPARLGAVVTNHGYSDWSTQNISATTTEILLRITRENSNYIVEYALPEVPEDWIQIRMAHLFHDDGKHPIMAGIYACSPIDSGYLVQFHYLKLEQN